MIDMQLIGHADFALESPDTCDNVGPCCYSCPVFDACEHHYDDEEAA